MYLRFLYLCLSASSKSCNAVKVKSLQMEVAEEEMSMQSSLRVTGFCVQILGLK